MLDIIVFGSEGQLGYDCTKILSEKYNVHPFSSLININDYNSIFEVIKQIGPEFVINCAAITDFKYLNQSADKYNKVNSDGVKKLSEICDKFGSNLIHISSNYVFDGFKSILQDVDSGYTVSDSTNPINIYGESKLKGEKHIQSILSENQYVILRVAWIYGIGGKLNNPANYVKTFINNIFSNAKDNIQISNNRYGSPTNTEDVSKFIDYLISNRITGLLHFNSNKYCTRYQFSKSILNLLNIKDVEIEIDDSINSLFPINNILSNTIHQYNIPTWQESIENFINKYSQSLLRGKYV